VQRWRACAEPADSWPWPVERGLRALPRLYLLREYEAEGLLLVRKHLQAKRQVSVQIGITLVGTLGDTFGGADACCIPEPRRLPACFPPGAASYAPSIAVAARRAGITCLTLVFGQLVPRRIASATQNPSPEASRPLCAGYHPWRVRWSGSWPDRPGWSCDCWASALQSRRRAAKKRSSI